MSIPKPPVGVQIDRSKDFVVLHSDATCRIVESIGSYPALMAADDTVISDAGYLMDPANATAVKNKLAAFLSKNELSQFKRWGAVLRAFAKEVPVTQLVPYPRLREILLSVSGAEPAAPAPVVPVATTPNKTASVPVATKKATAVTTPKATVAAPISTTPIAPIAAPITTGPEKSTHVPALPAPTKESKSSTTAQKRAKPSTSAPVENEHKRIKLDAIRTEKDLSTVTAQQWMMLLGEYQKNPADCARKYNFILDTSLRLYHALRQYTS